MTPPTLGISGKLQQKEGFIFGGAPNFWDQIVEKNPSPHHSTGRMGMDELQEFIDDKKEIEKEQKKKKRKIPSTSQIRKHMRDIILFHKEKAEEAFPCIYPLMSDKLEEDEDESKKTKEEDYNRPKLLPVQKKLGKRKRTEDPPKSRKRKK